MSTVHIAKLRLWICLLWICLVAACGGGSTSSGTAPVAHTIRLAGLAAVGAAIGNSSVEVRCSNGEKSVGRTDFGGAFELAVPNSARFPCLLRVVGSEIPITLHGIAVAAGTVNITPLTELILAVALGQSPQDVFNNFDDESRVTLAARVQSAMENVRAEMAAVFKIEYELNPLNGIFQIGDQQDKVLDRLSDQLRKAGISFNDLRLAAIVGTPFSAILTAETGGGFTTPEKSAGFDASGNRSFGFGGGSDIAQFVAFQSDGKLIVAGATAIVRLNVNGTLDRSFAYIGKLRIPVESIVGFAIDDADRIIVVGGTESLPFVSQSNDTLVLRYQSNGQLDLTYGESGKFKLDRYGALRQSPGKVAIQKDGKLVIVGGSHTGDPGAALRVIRVTANGGLDVEFGKSGIADFPSFFPYAVGALGVDSLGRTVMLGHESLNGQAHIIAFRLDPAGNPDPSFGNLSNGVAYLQMGETGVEIGGLAIDSNSRIVGVGYRTRPSWDFLVLRIDERGEFDRSFGVDGQTTIPGNGVTKLNAVAFDANEQIVVAGVQQLNNPGASATPIVARLSTQGQVQNSFGVQYFVGGRLALSQNRGGYNGVSVESVAIDKSGRPVFVGYDGWDQDFAVWRLQTDGMPDMSFGVKGQSLVDVSDAQAVARSMVRLADGSLLISGYTLGYARSFAIAKLSPDGTFDHGFGEYGRTTIQVISGGYNQAHGMTVLSDGSIVLVGQCEFGAQFFCAIKLLQNGALDQTFGDEGKVVLSAGSFARAFSVVADVRGGIVIAGRAIPTVQKSSSTPAAVLYSAVPRKAINSIASNGNFGTSIVVLRLDSSGILDQSFGVAGKVVTLLNGDDIGAGSMALDAKGNILIAGGYNGNLPAVVRLDPTGNPDPSFGVNGLAQMYDNIQARIVKVDPFGRIWVIGRDRGAFRLLENGLQDMTFGQSGFATLVTPSHNLYPEFHAATFDHSGRLLLAGSLYNAGRNDFALVRLLSDGKIDRSLSATGVYSTVPGIAYSIAMETDGGAILAGANGVFVLSKIDKAVLNGRP